MEENKKKKAGKIIALILALLCGGTAVAMPALKNSKAYKAAEKILESGDYEAAQAAFAELGDYKDAPEQVKECLYRQAQALYEQGEVDKAAAIWKTLGDYADSAERMAAVDAEKAAAAKDAEEAEKAAKAAEEKAAEEAAKTAETEKAAEEAAKAAEAEKAAEEEAESAAEEAAARNIAPLTDPEELRVAYMDACRALDNGNYEEAIKLFSQCPDYAKANRKLLEAKYGYVHENPDRDNPTTMAYLQDMKDANYGGYQYMYNLVYAWHVEVTAINIDPNSEEHMEMICKTHEIFVHYKVSGGPPDGKLHMCMTGKLPAYYAGSWYKDVVAGDEGVFSFRYTKEPKDRGTVSALFHDQNGKLIGMRSTFLCDVTGDSGK